MLNRRAFHALKSLRSLSVLFSVNYSIESSLFSTLPKYAQKIVSFKNHK